MVGWHHQLNGHVFEQTLGESGGQMSLVCCSPWGHKESDTTKTVNSNNGGLGVLMGIRTTRDPQKCMCLRTRTTRDTKKFMCLPQ